MKKDTVLTTAGRNPAENFGIVNPPVYHASTIAFETVAELEAGDANPFEGVHYGRQGTPTTFAFQEAVAALEGGEATLALPSGMAAIACALLAFVKSGDHVLITDSVYFPTRRFCGSALNDFGVETTYFDPMIGAGISELIRPETKIVFVEAPGSLTFEVQDIPTIAEAAHARGALVVMDNTYSAGLFYQPFEKGVDISVQAATKFIVGHSDAMLGTITTRNDLINVIKAASNNYGYCAGPDDCYLGLRGIRSLSPRMARHQENGLKLAEWLMTRPEVETVLHPALPACPGHEIWKRDFTGACGLFGVVLKPVSKKALTAMLDGLEIFSMGYSWGGYESLIIPTYPAKIRTATEWSYAGPSLRIHTGLEDADDLIADLEAGLKRLSAAS
ncbi:MAG: cystathionine beta-lyase [Rhodospirillales bacterium]|jgi:cysteine-S-conjugate beta-lyase|nr:cystathionine beta-lyase [Rhodospirillales bacterium]